MRKYYLVFFISIFFLSCVTQPQYLNVSSVTKYSNEAFSKKTRRGRKIFNGKGLCWACHGIDADSHTKIDYRVSSLNPKPTDLRDPNVLRNKDDGRIFFIIKNGTPETAMGAAVKTLSDSQIWALIDYLKEIRENKQSHYWYNSRHHNPIVLLTENSRIPNAEGDF